LLFKVLKQLVNIAEGLFINNKIAVPNVLKLAGNNAEDLFLFGIRKFVDIGGVCFINLPVYKVRIA